MGTTAKKPLRKDKYFGIDSIFEERDAKKAELEKAEEQNITNIDSEPAAVTKKSTGEGSAKSKDNPRTAEKPAETAAIVSDMSKFRKKSNGVRRSFYLEKDISDYIDSVAEQTGATISEVVRVIVKEYMENNK